MPHNKINPALFALPNFLRTAFSSRSSGDTNSNTLRMSSLELEVIFLWVVLAFWRIELLERASEADSLTSLFIFAFGIKKRGVVGYFRFRNSISPSGVVAMYSNPFSIRVVASSVLLVALHVHSSVWLRNVACSRLM